MHSSTAWRLFRSMGNITTVQNSCRSVPDLQCEEQHSEIL
uniref:Uncharacterized protein n=1 Tax=Timema poppense TaxID=170557 RepID=A0A7R9DV77_TIMPO|nr:unnamed protein product [Timema poppensis]